jgi:hypothetical protein
MNTSGKIISFTRSRPAWAGRAQCAGGPVVDASINHSGREVKPRGRSVAALLSRRCRRAAHFFRHYRKEGSANEWGTNKLMGKTCIILGASSLSSID